MVSFFDSVREISLYAVLVRMVIAVLCGGFIGIEREYKRRPAGFRTHILICLGAALTTMTSQYILSYTGYYTDVSRMGAQVIAGMGFIGAGCIVINPNNRVTGLTTAAGLWVSAIVGLAIGAGFYEAGLFTTGVILFAEIVFAKIEYKLIEKTPEISLYVECAEKHGIDDLLQVLREKKIKITNFATTHISESGKSNSCVIISMRANKKYSAKELIEEISKNDGVVLIERV